MISKCKWLLFDYDFQMQMIFKRLCYANDYDIQMQMISKRKWYSNANDIQMQMIII